MNEQDQQRLDDIRRHLANKDDLGFVTPSSPAVLRRLTSSELGSLYRKIAFANEHKFDRMIELEISSRLGVALEDFAKAANRSSRRMEWLTIAIVLLTAVLVYRELFG